MCQALCLHMLIRFSQQSRLVILNHFTDEGMEAQSVCPACPRPQSWMVAELSLELGLLGFQAGPCNREELPVSFHVGWELGGIVEPVSKGCGPAERRPPERSGGSRGTFSGGSLTPREAASLPHPHPSPSFFLWGKEAEGHQTKLQGLGKRCAVLGFGFTIWKWKLMLSGKTPSFVIKTGISSD